MNNIKEIKLNDNNTIPELGIGVYCIYDEEECIKAVINALKLGYRHIDTASIYKNEEAVGKAIKMSGIPREEIFVTTKVWIDKYGYDKCIKSVEESLKKLDLEYIDMVLLHQRYNDIIGAYKALEDLKDKGLIKSIGVSNFRRKDLDKLLKEAKYIPVVDQVECHPFREKVELKKYLDERNIKLEAWYPLGHGDKKLINNEIFVKLGEKYNKSTVQIILKWHLQKNHIIFPKTLNYKHMEDNMNIYDFELNEEDMKLISTLNKEKSYVPLPNPLMYIVYSLSGFFKFK